LIWSVCDYALAWTRHESFPGSPQIAPLGVLVAMAVVNSTGAAGRLGVPQTADDLFPTVIPAGPKRNSRRGSSAGSEIARLAMADNIGGEQSRKSSKCSTTSRCSKESKDSKKARTSGNSANTKVSKASKDTDVPAHSDSGSSGGEEGFASEEEGGSAPSAAPKASWKGVRRNSQQHFCDRTHTTLLLDWDDTIFPTTWVRNDCGMNWKLGIEEQLDPGPRKTLIKELLAKLLEKVDVFFEEAACRATVFIVTLARRPWVDMSAANFLPGLARNLQKYNVKVIYAQEYMTDADIIDYQREEFLQGDARDFWTKVKCEAISRELDVFHREIGASWKNVISFGDSDFERFGTIAAGEEYMRRELQGGDIAMTGATTEGISKDGHLIRLRLKTVKMLSEPTIEELTAELALLNKWLPYIVQKDSGFDLVLDSTEDNEQLQKLHREMTGEDADFTWEQLAGMDEG